MTATDSGTAGNAARRGRVTTFTLALNYLPLVQLLTGAAVVMAAGSSPRSRFLLAAVWLYLVPPLVCRLTLIVFGRPRGRRLTQNTGGKVWWFTHRWQVVFNRLPWLENCCGWFRLYALWIWLWGGSEPLGLLGADRSRRHLVIVEAGAVIRMECRPHRRQPRL